VKEKIKKYVSVFIVLAVLVLPLFMYHSLLRKRAGEALAYSHDLLWAAVLLCLLFSALALICFLRLFSLGEESEEEAEEIWDNAYEEESSFEKPEENSLAMEEYPELFRKSKEAFLSEKEPHSPLENILRTLEMQKSTDEEPQESDGASVRETDEEVISFLSSGDKGDAQRNDIYDNIPDSLPEGYEPYTLYGDEEDENEEEDVTAVEEAVEERKRKAPFLAALALTFAVALSYGSAFALSYCYTAPEKDGIRVGRMFFEKEYLWTDAKSYTVDSTVFGKLRICVEMKDGCKRNIIPAGLIATEEGEGEFASIYAYAAYADEKLSEAGAKKMVKDKKALERDFSQKEDGSYEYVKKIIKE